MPYEKNLTVKHLKVKESEKIPVKVVSVSTTLYGEDSGKTITIPLLTNPINITLPSAKTGRNLKVVLNQINSGTLGANVYIAVKNTGEFINGHLPTAPAANGNNSQADFNGTSQTKVVINNGNSPVAGTVLNFVCNGSNVWTVTGLGVQSANAGNSVFSTS